MFLSSAPRRILAYSEPVDMRKSFTGLIAVVQGVLREDPLSGSLSEMAEPGNAEALRFALECIARNADTLTYALRSRLELAHGVQAAVAKAVGVAEQDAPLQAQRGTLSSH